MAKEKPTVLKLSNRTLKIGHETYNLRNLTKIGIYEIKPKHLFSVKWMLIFFIVGMVLVSIEDATAALVGFIVFCLGLCGIVERFIKKTSYGLQIETSSGSGTLVSSPDKKFMERVIDKIHEVMEKGEMAANYIIDMQDKSIHIGGNVERSTFNHY